MQLFGDSLVKALRSVYPHHPWQSWKFEGVPLSRNFFDEPENVKQYLQWLPEKLKVKQMTDWHEVSQRQLLQHKGKSLLERNGGLYSVLNQHFPGHKWDLAQTSVITRKLNKEQQVLCDTVQGNPNRP